MHYSNLSYIITQMYSPAALRSVDYEATRDDALERFRDPTYLPSFDEVTGTFCGKPDAWTELVGLSSMDGNFFSEYFTLEYIEGLAAHLRELLEGSSSPTILEVGAGAGRLSYFCRRDSPKLE